MTDVTPPAVVGASLLRYCTIDGWLFISCPACHAMTWHTPDLWPLAETVRAFDHTDPSCPVLQQMAAALRAFAHGEAPLT